MVDRVGQQLGHYHLLRLLGQGGFADVYLAEHIHLETQVAVKVLSMRLVGEHVEQFRAEARTVAHLVHPHIVRVLDFGVEDGTPYLVMDYASGGSLRTLHPKGTRLPLPTIVNYVKQVAEALQYAHDQKLIHRDIKPENMLLGENRRILLSDFGIALVTQSTRYQSTQDVAGTAAYMAPEQLQGKPRQASDQYALGIVVYEWLCGDRPFHGTFPELYSQHLFVSPAPLREKIPLLSPDVERVVLTALEKDPHQRFARVQDFAHALEQASQFELRSLASPSEPHPASSLPPPPSLTVLPSLQTASPMLHPQDPVLPSQQERETVLSVSPSTEQITSGSTRRAISTSKRVLLIGLVLLAVVGSVGLLSFPAHNWIAVHPHPSATFHLTVTAQLPALANSNTAMFGFDVGHTHFNSTETVLTSATVSRLTPSWMTPTTGPIDSSPAIANSMVYVGSNDKKVYAFDAKTGAIVWTALTGGQVNSSPAIANGMVYIGSDKLYAFDAKTGATRWTAPTDKAVWSSPAVANGIVYIGSWAGKLYAFDARTGTSLWTASTGNAINYSSPAVVDGLVYTGSYAHEVFAFDAKTGTTHWTAPTGDFIESSLAAANGVVYAAAHDGKLYAFDARTGVPRWTTPTGSNLFSSPAIVNGVIYDTSVGGNLYAFDAKTGAILWTTSTGGSIFSSPTVANGVVYVGSWSDHKLYAFDMRTGRILWTYSTGGSIFSSPLVANGVVYVGSEDHKLYAFHLSSTA